jgi:hypothetical protein
MPDSVLTEVTERMKAARAKAEAVSSGDGSAQSKASSSTNIPNSESSDKKESGGTNNGEPKSNSSRHWMTAFYIIVAGIAVYAIYKNYKANSIVKPPFRNPDGSFNRDSLFMSPVFITGKEVLKWVTILLGVAVLLWGLNKVMSQIKILEKNTFA